MPGFYSERTAEYTLVPKFAELLKPLGSVIPIFYSKQREGTAISTSAFGDSEFHLVALFARRPKIKGIGSQSIEGKINGNLFAVAECAAGFGVPTFCGISATNNVFDQSISESLWFDISKVQSDQDEIFTCEIDEQLKISNFTGNIKPSPQSKILSRVASSKKLTWPEAVSLMDNIPSLTDYYEPAGHPMFSSTWRLKPVYFAIRLE